MPLGATVGSAGLSVLPYDVRFTGDFFEIADLFKGVDQMVDSEAAKAADVAELADGLGLERFAMVGLSGGGPWAAACAALIPERLAAVASALAERHALRLVGRFGDNLFHRWRGLRFGRGHVKGLRRDHDCIEPGQRRQARPPRAGPRRGQPARRRWPCLRCRSSRSPGRR